MSPSGSSRRTNCSPSSKKTNNTAALLHDSVSLRAAVFFAAALTHGLIEDRRGGRGDVERLRLPAHGDVEVLTRAQKALRYTVRLIAENDNRGATQIRRKMRHGIGVARGSIEI